MARATHLATWRWERRGDKWWRIHDVLKHRGRSVRAATRHGRCVVIFGPGTGYVIRRAAGDLVGPFESSMAAQEYMVRGDEMLVVNEHGNVIDYGPQFGPDDDTVENCRLWLADPLAVNWASRATVGDLIDEIDRLRAEVKRLSQRRYELLHEVAELRQGTA